ncbi:RsmE family RNA methyltransferase, partial [bacterium]|nr:RsmE family RNA methyltransferase [bacterium]
MGSITHYLGSDQWRKVFRFKAGDKVILFDGSGFDFLCEIQSYTANTQGRGEKSSESCAEVKILEVMNNVVVPVRETSLFCAVLKKDTFEWVVEKATEMGVSRIVPVLAERSEKKNLNIERLQKIIIEASEQSGRGTLPV